MHTGKPTHLKHFDYTGFHRYSLTFCTDRRRPLFESGSIVQLALSQILRAAVSCEFTIVAYCFMPDHLHLLVHGASESADCKRFIALAKQCSGYLYAQKFGGKLWQRYGYERTLRQEEDSLTVARYILDNPVRARLVACISEYAFVGSAICSVEELLGSLPQESG